MSRSIPLFFLTLVWVLGTASCEVRAQKRELPQPSASQITEREKAQRLAGEGAIAFEEGRFDEAEATLRNSLKEGENPEAYYWLGRLYATKASSSPTARRLAIENFRRSLELQPYGEDGETTRGWLIRIGGRPKTIKFMQANWGKDGDERATRALAERLSATAKAQGFRVIESARDVLEMDKVQPEQLVQECSGEEGALESGWMVCVGVDSFDVQWVDGKGKAKGGYRASGEAQVQVFDPLSRILHKPVRASNVSLDVLSILLNGRSDSSSDATNIGMMNLSEQAWNKCRIIIGANPDPALLDETTFPLRIPGVYGRAAVPYAKAVQLPLVALTACSTGEKAQHEKGTDAARLLAAELQSALLRSGTIAVITPGGMRSALKAFGEPTDSTDIQQVCAAAHRGGARYAIMCNLTQFDIGAKNQFVMTKVTARVALDVTLLDTDSSQQIFHRTYTQSAGASKVLGGPAVKTVIAKQTQALMTVRDAAVRDLLASISGGVAPASESPSQPSGANGNRAVQMGTELGLASHAPVPAATSPNLAPLVVDGHPHPTVLVSVEALARWMGGSVERDDKYVRVKRGTRAIQMRYSSRDAVVTGEHMDLLTLSVPTQEQNGVFYAPIEPLMQSLGGTCTWDQSDGALLLAIGNGPSYRLALPVQTPLNTQSSEAELPYRAPLPTETPLKFAKPVQPSTSRTSRTPPLTKQNGVPRRMGTRKASSRRPATAKKSATSTKSPLFQNSSPRAVATSVIGRPIAHVERLFKKAGFTWNRHYDNRYIFYVAEKKGVYYTLMFALRERDKRIICEDVTLHSKTHSFAALAPTNWAKQEIYISVGTYSTPSYSVTLIHRNPDGSYLRWSFPLAPNSPGLQCVASGNRWKFTIRPGWTKAIVDDFYYLTLRGVNFERNHSGADSPTEEVYSPNYYSGTNRGKAVRWRVADKEKVVFFPR